MLISLQFKGRRIALKLRWNSSDFLAFEQIFIKEEYAPLVHSALKSPVIVDAGANIGCTTIYLKVVYPSATILSIEADPGNFEILKENIKLNGFDGIMPMHVALWYFNGTVQLARNYRDNRDWSVTVSKKGDVSVSSQTFETILLANPGSIDILKMDIEGAEIEIFRNDSLIGDTLRKVKYLAVEVHDDLENLVENKLNEVGFDVFNQGESLFGRNTRI